MKTQIGLCNMPSCHSLAVWLLVHACGVWLATAAENRPNTTNPVGVEWPRPAETNEEFQEIVSTVEATRLQLELRSHQALRRLGSTALEPSDIGVKARAYLEQQADLILAHRNRAGLMDFLGAPENRSNEWAQSLLGLIVKSLPAESWEDASLPRKTRTAAAYIAQMEARSLGPLLWQSFLSQPEYEFSEADELASAWTRFETYHKGQGGLMLSHVVHLNAPQVMQKYYRLLDDSNGDRRRLLLWGLGRGPWLEHFEKLESMLDALEDAAHRREALRSMRQIPLNIQKENEAYLDAIKRVSAANPEDIRLESLRARSEELITNHKALLERLDAYSEELAKIMP